MLGGSVRRIGTLAVAVIAVVIGVGLTGPPAGALPGGFTVAPPGATVGANLTVTATWDVACDLIDSRLFLLPPVGDDTPIAENGTGASGDTQVLLDITPDDIPTAATYRLRMICGNPSTSGAEYFVDFPVTEPEPEPEPEPETETEPESDAPPAADVVAARPAFTG